MVTTHTHTHTVVSSMDEMERRASMKYMDLEKCEDAVKAAGEA